MPAYFFDTSALVKRYAVEQGSDWVRATADDRASDIYIASITRDRRLVSFFRTKS